MIIKSLHRFSRSSFSKHYLLALSYTQPEKAMAHLVSALGNGTSLLTLRPALLDHVLVLEHAAGLLHELAHGGVVLAILVILVGIVGGVAAVVVVA